MTRGYFARSELLNGKLFLFNRESFNAILRDIMLSQVSLLFRRCILLLVAYSSVTTILYRGEDDGSIARRRQALTFKPGRLIPLATHVPRAKKLPQRLTSQFELFSRLSL